MRLPRPIVRLLAALVGLVAVLGAVSACQVKAGTAAFVGDQRITDSTISSYLLRTQPVAAPQAGQPSARDYAVTFLIRRDLFRDYLDRKGVASDPAALSRARGQALAGSEDQIQGLYGQVAQLGLQGTFVDLLVEYTILQFLASQKSGITDASALFAEVDKGAPTVQLSPRYGTWSAPQQSVAPGSTTPSYLQLSSTSVAA